MAVILILVGAFLLLAEALLPTQGVLGVLGGAALVGAVIAIFLLGPWYGIATLALLVLISPFVFMWMMRIWPKTPVGKRLVLNAVVSGTSPAPKVSVGAIGTTVTELRPIGECDFEDQRIEVISELGLIDPGTQVKVVAHEPDGRPIVRAIA